MKRSVVPPEMFWLAEAMICPTSTSRWMTVPSIGARIVTLPIRSRASSRLVSALTSCARALASSSAAFSYSRCVMTFAARSSAERSRWDAAVLSRCLGDLEVGLGLGKGVAHVARVDDGEEVAAADEIAGLDVQLEDLAGGLGLDLDDADWLDLAGGFGADLDRAALDERDVGGEVGLDRFGRAARAERARAEGEECGRPTPACNCLHRTPP